MDHTRIAALKQAGVTKVKAIIHELNETLPEGMVGRFGNARTWEEAVQYRTGQ